MTDKMTNLFQVTSLLPKYKDLCKIMKIVSVLQNKIDELEQRIEKLEKKRGARCVNRQ